MWFHQLSSPCVVGLRATRFACRASSRFFHRFRNPLLSTSLVLRSVYTCTDLLFHMYSNRVGRDHPCSHCASEATDVKPRDRSRPNSGAAMRSSSAQLARSVPLRLPAAARCCRLQSVLSSRRVISVVFHFRRFGHFRRTSCTTPSSNQRSSVVGLSIESRSWTTAIGGLLLIGRRVRGDSNQSQEGDGHTRHDVLTGDDQHNNIVAPVSRLTRALCTVPLLGVASLLSARLYDLLSESWLVLLWVVVVLLLMLLLLEITSSGNRTSASSAAVNCCLDTIKLLFAVVLLFSVYVIHTHTSV